MLSGMPFSTSTATAHYHLIQSEGFKALILACVDKQVKHFGELFHVKPKRGSAWLFR
jgi:hypothetical protein